MSAVILKSTQKYAKTNERFTIERSELTNGNFECVRQTEDVDIDKDLIIRAF